MWALPQPDLLRLFFRRLQLPTVSQHSADHPKSCDADGGSAVNEGRPVLRVISDLQKLCCLFFLGLAKDDRNIEVAQTQFFHLCFFFGGTVLARWAKIDDGLNAF